MANIITSTDLGGGNTSFSTASISIPTLMASKTAVDGAALASTALTFESGVTLATHVPTLVIYKFASGALGIGVAKIKNSVADISALTVLLALTATQEVSALASGTLVNSGNISVEVTTASLAASTFNCYVYGTPRP